jgi:hypothetical protein
LEMVFWKWYWKWYDEQAHSVEGQEKPVSRPRAAASSRSGFP